MGVRKIRFDKKAAFEMSISTMIIIVIGVLFLIMALALLRNIFFGAEQSVDIINGQVMTQLRSLFTDDNQKIIIKLPSNTLDIKSGTSNFGFAVAARTKYGTPLANYSGIQYKLELVKTSECYTKLGATMVARWFVAQKISSDQGEYYNDVDNYDQTDMGGASIKLTIPEGTILCTQAVKISFVDNTSPGESRIPIGGDTITINIERAGIAGIFG